VTDTSSPSTTFRPTRAEIDLSAITHNLRVVRDVVRDDGETPAVYGVVKADGYGHGAVAVGKALQRAGADGLCVALVEEGVILRNAGVTLPILVMSGIYGAGIEEAVVHALTPVLYDEHGVDRALAWHGDTPVDVHLKIDTGMARLGVEPSALARVVEKLSESRHIRVRGLMTHFANADCDDDAFTYEQLRRFGEVRAVVQRSNLRPSVIHAAASAAAFRTPEARFHLVRAGIALYGVAPFPNTAPGLLPAMRLRTEVISLRTLHVGTTSFDHRNHSHWVRRWIFSSAFFGSRSACTRYTLSGSGQCIDGSLHR
jgi:alanine racemase